MSKWHWKIDFEIHLSLVASYVRFLPTGVFRTVSVAAVAEAAAAVVAEASLMVAAAELAAAAFHDRCPYPR